MTFCMLQPASCHVSVGSHGSLQYPLNNANHISLVHTSSFSSLTVKSVLPVAFQHFLQPCTLIYLWPHLLISSTLLYHLTFLLGLFSAPRYPLDSFSCAPRHSSVTIQMHSCVMIHRTSYPSSLPPTFALVFFFDIF